MFAIEDTVLTNLTDQIDELSTKLIIDGVSSLTVEEFERFSVSASEQSNPQLAQAAAALAKSFAAIESGSIPERTRLLSTGLEHLRRVLEDPSSQAVDQPSAPSAASSATVSEAPPAPSERNALAADPGLVLDFVTEAGEHVVMIEKQMLILEKDNTATETLNAIFRAYHTIKGLAGFLEIPHIQSLAHNVENLLDLARNSRLPVTPSVVDLVLECTDYVRLAIADIELELAGKTPPAPASNEVLLRRIEAVVKQTTNGSSDAPSAESVVATTTPTAPVEERKGVVVSSGSVRIDTGKLDQLMDMVGEMVIAQTLIGHSPALSSVKDTKLLRDLSQLARITTDVQRIATGMRMVTIGTQFQKTARVVRDLSRRAGKNILLETVGEDTELDKAIAEELADPLLHMVRNSIDHGIEDPEERAAAGKDPIANIRLAAYHQSGQIVIAISDDGRGLNREKILAKAQKNGLIQNGAQLTDNEIFLLIFEPGFSTAEKVTDISGRGVGMDVVRRHVQKLRGRIEIKSEPGQGTTFYMKLPLTMAIIEGLVVVVGENRYILPIFSVKEMFRPTAEMLSTVQGTGEMAIVRNALLPIVRLHRRFDIVPRTENFTEGTLIVAESLGHQFCLFVDDLVGKQEVVIKSLGESFKQVVGVAGCAILGDGRVGLILDVDGIYERRS
jgi:two-component system chemotaxis sensor kinase CheA